MTEQENMNQIRNELNDIRGVIRNGLIGLIGVLISAGATAVWWAGESNSRIEGLEETAMEITREIEANKKFHTSQRVRLWDRVNEVHGLVLHNQSQMAEIKGELKALNKNISAFMRIVLDRAEINKSEAR